MVHTHVGSDAQQQPHEPMHSVTPFFGNRSTTFIHRSSQTSFPSDRSNRTDAWPMFRTSQLTIGARIPNTLKRPSQPSAASSSTVPKTNISPLQHVVPSPIPNQQYKPIPSKPVAKLSSMTTSTPIQFARLGTHDQLPSVPHTTQSSVCTETLCCAFLLLAGHSQRT